MRSGRANSFASWARAGSEVRSPTYTPLTITPGAIDGTRVAPGAAAQASATNATRMTARWSMLQMVCAEAAGLHAGCRPMPAVPSFAHATRRLDDPFLLAGRGARAGA